MKRLRIEICAVNGAIVAASCVEGIAPLKGMWQVWRLGDATLPELQASIESALFSITNQPKKTTPTTGRIRKLRHG